MGVAVGPLFFTSHASGAGDRGSVQRFHADVQQEVHALLGRGGETLGVLKDVVPASSPDPAVLDCRAMLVLYSPEYLRDAQCVREWSLFRERLDRWELQTRGEPGSLVGVLWKTEGLALPQAVVSTGNIVGEAAAPGGQESGVLRLQCEPPARDQYRTLVRRVAERLVRAAPGGPPGLSRADARRVEPRFAFYRPAPPTAEPAFDCGRPVPGSDGPPPRVIVALATGTRARMETLRRSVAAYGDSPEEWRPFQPQSEEAAVSIVGRSLRSCGVERLTVVPLDAGEPRPPSCADESSIVMLVVDSWMSEDASFPLLWRQLEDWGTGIAGVIVVLPLQDAESRVNIRGLREAMARTPARALGAPHHEVGSLQSLAYTVAGILADSSAGHRGPCTAPDEPQPFPLESPSERRQRRRQEREGWIKQGERTLSALVSETAGGMLSGG